MSKVKFQFDEHSLVKHTDGPWVVKIGGPDQMSDIFAPKLGEDYRIAYVLHDSNKNQSKIDKANAALIASAPDLLAALKHFREQTQRGTCVGKINMTMIDDVIEKAEGR